MAKHGRQDYEEDGRPGKGGYDPNRVVDPAKDGGKHGGSGDGESKGGGKK